jgi:uncharacterized cupin superfamily protein
MPRLDVAALPEKSGSRYPAPHHEPVMARRWVALGDAGGLTDFGVNLVILPPNVWSSQRHWHAHEDEFVYVIEGELVLIDDFGEHPMPVGSCATFKAGDRNGHHLVNRSGQEARFLVVGSRKPEDFGEYSDIDMRFEPETKGGGYATKAGEKLTPRAR